MKTRTPLLGVAVALASYAAAVGYAVPEREAQDPTMESWKAHLEFLTAGSRVLIASNEEHRTVGSGQPVAYGQAFRLVAGDVAGRGCLWSVLPDGSTRLEWDFLVGWDTEAAAPFVFQSSRDGDVGFGHVTSIDGPESETIQTFEFANGAGFRGRHHTTEAAPDTLTTRSFQMVDGEWQPGRTDRWIRQPEGAEAPCLD